MPRHPTVQLLVVWLVGWSVGQLVGWSDEAEKVTNLLECVNPDNKVKRLNDFV